MIGHKTFASNYYLSPYKLKKKEVLFTTYLLKATNIVELLEKRVICTNPFY